MTGAQIEIILIAAVVASSCALVGSFLVLRRMSLMSDAISHAILLGIVIAFFTVRESSTPAMFLGATLTGVFTVFLVESLHRTRLVKEDAAIGLVFPALFSIGVILVSKYAGQVHLDTDAVLLGELAFAPFDRLSWGTADLGPRALWTGGVILLLNALFIILLYKELKITTFDPLLSAAIGISPSLVHYSLMTLVSLTAVSAFDAVGSILVVALMVATPAAAYLITDRLAPMILLGVLFGITSAVSGYFLARWLDASIAGSMAVMTGFIFLAALLLAPSRGLLFQVLRHHRQRLQFSGEMLLVHLSQHEGRPEQLEECAVGHLEDHLRWTRRMADRVVDHLASRRLIEIREDGGLLELTEAGRARARRVMLR